MKKWVMMLLVLGLAATDGLGQRKILSILASTGGDGTGTSNAIGNYTGADSLDLLVGPPSRHYTLTRVMVTVQDNNNSFDPDKYGGITALSNGIQIAVVDSTDAIIYNLTAYPITTNGDWAAHCYDATLMDFGNGDEVLKVRWTFEKSGVPVMLDGAAGEYLRIRLKDNFTGLAAHRFLVQGYHTHQPH